MRQVVTGPGEDAAAAILSNGEPPTVIEAGQYRTTELSVTDGTSPAWSLRRPGRQALGARAAAARRGCPSCRAGRGKAGRAS